MSGRRGCLRRLRDDEGTVTVVMAGVLGALTVLAVMLVAGLAGLRAGAQASAAADAAALAAADALAGFPIDSSVGAGDAAGGEADGTPPGEALVDAEVPSPGDVATTRHALRAAAAPGVCTLAARVAAANGAALESCTARGACVLVTVTVRAALPVTRSANAGPPAGCGGE